MSREAEIDLICAAEPSWRPRSAQEAPGIARADGLDALGAPKKIHLATLGGSKKSTQTIFQLSEGSPGGPGRVFQGLLGGILAGILLEAAWRTRNIKNMCFLLPPKSLFRC